MGVMRTFTRPRQFAILLALVATARLFLYSAFGSSGPRNPFPEEALSNEADLYQLEPEWEWARNISIVYTWVNGSEPEYQEIKEAHGGTIDGERDRDNNELLYSLRSLTTYLPWHTGMVYFVTPGHFPSWLNISHPRVRIIDQNNLVPKEFLPTFNSNTLEQFLHLLPGLSDYFIHFNDDYFVRSYCHPSEFFTQQKGLKIFFGKENIPCDTDGREKYMARVKGKANDWGKSVIKSAHLVYDTLPTNNISLNILQHAPYVYHKRLFEEMHSLWPEELQTEAKYKFRARSNLAVPYIHHGLLIRRGKACCNIDHQILSFQELRGVIQFVSFGRNTTLNDIKIESLREQEDLKIFNLNDGMGVDAMMSEARSQMQEFLDEEFGDLSCPFEREPV